MRKSGRGSVLGWAVIFVLAGGGMVRARSKADDATARRASKADDATVRVASDADHELARVASRADDEVERVRSRADEEAVRGLPRAFCEAWAKHDGHALAATMAEDVDFVVVGATLIHGRADFEKYSVRLLSGRFKESKLTLMQTAVRFVRPDVAVVQWKWTAEGDKNPDGTARTPRYGLMTMVAEKRGGAWRVVAAQNDNSFPGLPPEFEGIRSPMPIPDQVGEQGSNPKN